MIQVLGLTKWYGQLLARKRVLALQDISVTVQRGTSVGLVGPNGSGKTTLFKILVGLLKPTSGSVSVLGSSPTDERVRDRIGFLPEEFRLPRFFTGLDVLRTIGSIYRIPSRELRERIDELLSLCRLTDWANKEVGRYSKGMLRKLAFAQALISQPDVLVLDEPFNGLDPLARREFITALDSARARGASIFLCSHILADVEQLCDEVAFIDSGRLLEVVSVARIARAHGFQVAVRAATLANLQSNGLEAYEFKQSGENYCTEVPDSESLRLLLRDLDRLRISVVSIEAVKKNLEDYFFSRGKRDVTFR